MLKNKLSLAIWFVCSVFLPVQAFADTVSPGSLGIYAGNTLEFGSGVSVDGPIGGVNSVSIGRDSMTRDIFSGGRIGLGDSVQTTGNIWADGDVNISRKALVDGNISVGGSYWKDKKADVTGTVSQGPDSTDISFLDFVPPADPGQVGSESFWFGRKSDTTLDPGSYKNLQFGGDATLNLSAGTYTLNNFWMDKGGTINVDTSLGDIVLNIHDGLSTGSDVVFNTTGGGNLFVNVFGKDAYLGDRNQFAGELSVYDGGISTGRDVQLTGAARASDRVWIGDGSSVHYVISDPQTMMLLVTGGGILLLHHRRRGFTFSFKR